MRQGYSFTSFSAVVHVNQDTLHNWGRLYPEFAEAKHMAFEYCRLFWEKKGIEGLFNENLGQGVSRSFNSSNWIFQMKNRFPKEWRDRQEVEQKVEQKTEVVYRAEWGGTQEPTDGNGQDAEE